MLGCPSWQFYMNNNTTLDGMFVGWDRGMDGMLINDRSYLCYLSVCLSVCLSYTLFSKMQKASHENPAHVACAAYPAKRLLVIFFKKKVSSSPSTLQAGHVSINQVKKKPKGKSTCLSTKDSFSNKILYFIHRERQKTACLHLWTGGRDLRRLTYLLVCGWQEWVMKDG